MRKSGFAISSLAPALITLAFSPLLTSCNKSGKLAISFPDRFEGRTVELIEYMDSTVLDSAIVRDGRVEFVVTESDKHPFPFVAQVMVDGRVNSYYIAEPGNAMANDSISAATGTPLNDRFLRLMQRLDSVDNLDDLPMYVDFVEKEYNAERGNVLADFLGVEWMKFADAARVDSFMNNARPGFADLKRVKYYAAFARHRLATAPGMKFTDIKGRAASGARTSLSRLMAPGKYTLVDMWASWCPYCIKEIPALKQLLADFSDKGLEIVGVAVRDLPADTKTMVEKHDIPWKVLYDTQKTPYDIYGFSGIPHHILIGPDGTIISRGENAEQLRIRLGNLLN